MALPSIVMSVAMKTIHLIVNIFGLTFSSTSSKILKIAWFLVRNWYLLVFIVIICILYYYEYWNFYDIWNIVSTVI